MGLYVLTLLVTLWVGDDVDWNGVTNANYKTEPASAAVQRYSERVTFLNDKLNEQVGIARDELRSELIAATQTALLDGQLDEVQLISSLLSGNKEQKPAKTKDPAPQKKEDDVRLKFAGRWAGAWGTTGNQFAITVSDNGGNLTIRNGRILMLNQPSEQLELILRGEQLVVLDLLNSAKL